MAGPWSANNLRDTLSIFDGPFLLHFSPVSATTRCFQNLFQVNIRYALLTFQIQTTL